MKLYCAISPFRIFLGRVSDPLSTSAKRPLSDNLVATSDAYSLYETNPCCRSHFLSSSIKILMQVTYERHSHRDDKDLPGREPEGPVETRQNVMALKPYRLYHFPAKCSVMIAMKRSILPKIARWMITGRLGGLSRLGASSADRYFKLKRSGNWKSS
jgi:hypothetical protein